MDGFIRGFVKAAEEYGVPEHTALQIAKEAGFWGGVGNFMYDAFAAPVVGAVNSGGQALSNLYTGNFGGALSQGAKFVGNAALTGLNFIPGAGLGRGIISGGSKLIGRGLGMFGARGTGAAVINGGRALGQGASALGSKMVGSLGTGANSAIHGVQAAAPKTTNFLAKNVPATAGFAGQQHYSDQRTPVQAPQPMPEPEPGPGMGYL